MYLKIAAFVITVIFIPLTSYSFEPGPGCSMDCAGCHTLTKEEAGKILKLNVKEVSESPVKGIWKIEGEADGQKGVVYLDYAKKNLILIQGFMPVKDITGPPKARKPREPRKIDVSSIPLTGTILMGDPNAKNKIIIFDDPDCPYCRKLHMETKKILEQRKDVAFYIKLYPLPMHPAAYEKSKSILCEKSLELLDAAMEGKDIPKAKCETKEVDENIETARKLGITGTPAIILPDGRLIPGYVEGKVLLQLLDTP